MTTPTQPKEQELLPCPFCGSTSLIRGYLISCAECSAKGPDNPQRHWNGRAPSPSSILAQELQNIINAKPDTWDFEDQEENLRQFVLWAKNRAADALKRASESPSSDQPRAWYCIRKKDGAVETVWDQRKLEYLIEGEWDIIEMVPKQAPSSAEPVAWLVESEKHRPIATADEDDVLQSKSLGSKVTPLYAHPPATGGEEEAIRRILIETMVVCISGFAEAAVVGDGPFGLPHVVKSMTMLADYAKKQKGDIEELKAEVARLRKVLEGIAGYALSVRLGRDREHIQGGEVFCLQTKVWCEGLIEECAKADKALTPPTEPKEFIETPTTIHQEAIEEYRKETKEEASLVKRAKELYGNYVDNSGMHCNRFSAWDELTEDYRQEWIAKAKEEGRG